MDTLRFTAIGKPQAKGAHTAFVPRRRDGSIVRRPSGDPLVVVKDTNPEQAQAADMLSVVALRARDAAGWGQTRLPVMVSAWFYFDRSQSDYGTGRNAAILRKGASRYPLTRADTDKLARQVLDALTGIIYADDKQVIDLLAFKRWTAEGEVARTEVEVTVLEQVVGDSAPTDQLALAA